MEIIDPKIRKITPEIAVKILKKHGKNITVKDAKIIFDFMYSFANLLVNQYIKI